ncbi:hypothetical protein HPB48_012130 [Haemaphysalis longicornis]|uniref:Uncharacterized protein n=1 Tax=Haemaphysalis longicornis TaxID=44386 RepID=A0A9J6FQ64_HAELO|nr:hypothetical protein HPB48_012130 [Haemaphysalis longicornis]
MFCASPHRNGHPVIIKENLVAHSVHPSDLTCRYREIYRNKSLEEPDKAYMKGRNRRLSFGKPLSKEFLLVKCASKQYPKSSFHEQFLLNPIVKKRSEEGLRKKIRQTPHNLSVLILGVDSVSNLNLHRQFPYTARLMREELRAFELHGYNKVGLNTLPNLYPLLMGLTNSEVTEAAPDGFYDPLISRFIASKYGKRGYTTMHLEESSSFGLFAYEGRGFRRAPADYYLRPVIQAMEQYSRLGSFGVPCLGPTMPFEELLDYLRRFLQTIGQRPFFAFAWVNDITHNNLNNAGYADAPVHHLLQSLRESGVLSRTLLVFLSDHGIRFGDIRETYLGKLEDRQPFAFLAFPAWFLGAHPEAARSLRVNQRRLTTPFDIHATLVELLEYPRLERPNTTYGLSLLHEVPDTRTCADASISRAWCTCSIQVDDYVSETLALSMADYMVLIINDELRKTPECSQYTLLDVLDVTTLQQTTAEREGNVNHYWVTVKLSPGGAVFEGTVQVRGDSVTNVTALTRVSWFSDTSTCSSYAKDFCFCRTKR